MAGNPTVVFNGPGKVSLEETEIPRPGRGEVLVRNLRTLISTGTELTILSGEFPAGSEWASYGKYPFIPGYSGVGVVEAVGEGVDESLVGGRFECYSTHSAYCAVAANGLYPVPDGVDSEEAAFATIAQIVFNGVRRGGPEWGETAVVYGCGLLGQLAVRALRLAGVLPVVGVDLSAWRLGLLPKDSGVLGLNPEAGGIEDAVREATGGRMADMVFEVTGAPAAIAGEMRLLRKGGRMVMLSSPRGTSEFDFHDMCNCPSVSIIGAHISSHPSCSTLDNPWTRARHAEFFFELVGRGEMDVRPLISHVGEYADAPGLFESLLGDRSGAMGVILDWESK
ncbi:MAG: zinc-binding dehydrogenase [Planctomycetes bacterium]|nr:zinc-binding dehydrogenase [Planctomycetota bacterium]